MPEQRTTGMKHMAMTPAYLIETLREWQRLGRPQEFVTQDGQSVSYEDAIDAARDYQRQGFEVIPPCDNTDPQTGRCLGHDR